MQFVVIWFDPADNHGIEYFDDVIKARQWARKQAKKGIHCHVAKILKSY